MADVYEWRCKGVENGRVCNKLLGKFQDLRRGAIMCSRCKTINRVIWPDGVPTEQRTPQEINRTGAR
jgi:phage FluMu protein Com